MSNQLKTIKILFPNNCYNQETLRLYNKDLSLGPERIQDNDGLEFYTHSFYVDEDELHHSIRSRIRDRSFNDGPDDFTTHRLPRPDFDLSDDESDTVTRIPIADSAEFPNPNSLALTTTFDINDATRALAATLRPPPISLPIEALREINSPMPGISLACSYALPSGDDLNTRAFATISEAVEYLTNLEQVTVWFSHWMVDAMQSTIVNGLNSNWNWGAPIGMPKSEFFRRVAPGFMYGGENASVRRLMSNPVLANDMDFKLAELITRRIERILVIKNQNRITTPIWPLAEPFLEDEEPGDLAMREFLWDNHMCEGELDTAVRAKGDGTGLWQEVDWQMLANYTQGLVLFTYARSGVPKQQKWSATPVFFGVVERLTPEEP
ncbi:hypothetical protein B0H10DRAFT_1961250 [Mycena sp. CBHHK59/15]|nr:hypothetical protein B0H10DRAFT_1961250 [Mycena sp. CBHHK59/15]